MSPNETWGCDSAAFSDEMTKALSGARYTPETVDTVAKLVAASFSPWLKAAPRQPGEPIPVPGRDAVVTITAEPTDGERVFQVKLTIAGPDARLVASDWGIQDLVEPERWITIEIAL